MYDRLAAALLGLTAGAGHITKRMDMGAMQPTRRSFVPEHTQRKIFQGMQQHAKDLNVDDAVLISTTGVTPENNALITRFPQALNQVAAVGTIPGANAPVAMINPNADRIWAAKALGGAAASQSKIGQAINQIYNKYATSTQNNPALTKALMASTLLAPIGISAALPGDNDSDEAVLASALPMTAIPLAKEAYETYQGQRVLDKSGLRTTLGQRGKMAGHLLSMMAVPVIAGSTGNMIGNIMD